MSQPQKLGNFLTLQLLLLGSFSPPSSDQAGRHPRLEGPWLLPSNTWPVLSVISSCEMGSGGGGGVRAA